MKRAHVVNVGAAPGLTRAMQEIQLDKHVKLLDSPGVVMAKVGDNEATIALRNCKRIEKLEDPISPGKIPYYTSPPTRNKGEHLESAIVSGWGKEFDVNEIYKEESAVIDSLHYLIDSSHVEMPANSPLNMDAHLSESEEEDAMEEANEPRMSPDATGMDTSEVVAAKCQRSQSQNDKLYDTEGILNPRVARAEKKRRKKAGKVPVEAANEREDVDYDFATDYKKQFAVLGREAESDEDCSGENKTDAEGIPMAGVELDA